jgi:hypothetical protein
MPSTGGNKSYSSNQDFQFFSIFLIKLSIILLSYHYTTIVNQESIERHQIVPNTAFE